MKVLIQLMIMIVTLVLCGCLQGEIEPTLFLENDGSVTLELFISAEDPNRDDEDLRDDLARNIAEIEEKLLGVGAESTTTKVIRDRSPFTFVTQASFAELAPILEILFEDWPGLQWEELRHMDSHTIRFYIDPEASLPDAIMSLKVVAVSGSIGRDGNLTRSMKLVKPADWQGTQFSW